MTKVCLVLISHCHYIDLVVVPWVQCCSGQRLGSGSLSKLGFYENQRYDRQVFHIQAKCFVQSDVLLPIGMDSTFKHVHHALCRWLQL